MTSMEDHLPLRSEALLREQDVATQLNISVYTLQKWRSRGGGPSFHRLGPKGSAVRYKQEDIYCWLRRDRRDAFAVDRP